jgi:hypothetical protein
MSAPQRAVAIAVAVLVIAAAGLLALAFADGRIGLGPDPSVAATPGASTAPSASAAPQPSADATASGDPADEDVLAAIAEIEAQVIAIRGLEAADIGAPDLITRAELADELIQLFDEQYPPEDRARQPNAARLRPARAGRGRCRAPAPPARRPGPRLLRHRREADGGRHRCRA